MSDWDVTLTRLNHASHALRPLVDAFLTHGEDAGVRAALDALVALIPSDVAERLQHPLTVTSKALAGALRQALDGRALIGDGPLPEWWTLLKDGVIEALDDFDRALAVLMKEGAAEH